MDWLNLIGGFILGIIVSFIFYILNKRDTQIAFDKLPDKMKESLKLSAKSLPAKELCKIIMESALDYELVAKGYKMVFKYCPLCGSENIKREIEPIVEGEYGAGVASYSYYGVNEILTCNECAYQDGYTHDRDSDFCKSEGY